MSKSLTDWFTRAARHIDPTDFLRLNPLEAVRTLWRFQKDRRGERLPEDDPGVRDPEFVGVLLDICRALGTYYLRYQVRGIDNVPAEGPALLVGSHNGGIVTLDSLLTLVAVWDRFGPARAVHPLAHDILFSNELTRKYAESIDAIREREDLTKDSRLLRAAAARGGRGGGGRARMHDHPRHPQARGVDGDVEDARQLPRRCAHPRRIPAVHRRGPVSLSD